MPPLNCWQSILRAGPRSAKVTNPIEPFASPNRAVCILPKKIFANYGLSVALLCLVRVYLLAGVPLEPDWFSSSHNFEKDKDQGDYDYM